MIIDLQRRLAEIGRIRIGQQVTSANGKARPAKLDTFRLTSPDKTRVEHAARLWGGTPRQWDAPAGKQWEVITTTPVIDVIVPPSDMAFSQWYELWSAGGCQRRCDGHTESISDGPCLCDPDDRACDIHSRLSVLLADLPGLGVWRIDTSGYYAAVELQGAVEVIRLAAGRGQMLPARLRLEQRSVKRNDERGKPVTRRFAVPVLDIDVSPGQLLAAGAGPVAIGGRVDQATGEVLDGAAPLTPVPDTVPARPVASVAEQAAAVDTPTARPRRRNAAAKVPATGVAPRTAAQAAAAAEPPDPGPPPRRPVTPVDELPQMITRPQQKKMLALCNEVGLVEREDRLNLACLVIDRNIDSSDELTYVEAGLVIDKLVAVTEDRLWLTFDERGRIGLADTAPPAKPAIVDVELPEPRRGLDEFIARHDPQPQLEPEPGDGRPAGDVASPSPSPAAPAAKKGDTDV